MLNDIAWAMAPAQEQGTQGGDSGVLIVGSIVGSILILLVSILVYIRRKRFLRKKQPATIAEERHHYKTAFSIAKLSETVGWAIMVVGVVVGGISGFNPIGLAVVAVSVVLGIFCVFQSQLILIVIDTENNTRQMTSELKKANVILKENADVMLQISMKMLKKEL